MTNKADLPKAENFPIISGVEGDAEEKGAKTSDLTEGTPRGGEPDVQESPRLRQPSGRRPLFRS